jgi:hypothetical protein
MIGQAWRSVSAACVLAMGGVSWAEPVEIKAALPQGREIALSIEYALDVKQSAEDGQQAGKSIRQEALVRFVVEGVAEDGTAALRGSVERLSMVWQRGEERGEFARPRVTADVPADTPLNAAMAALGEAILSAPIQMAVSPIGRVEAIRGLNDVVMTLNSPAVRGEGASPLVDQSALGMFGSRQFAAMVGSAFTADGAGQAARSVGDEWETTESIPAPPAGTVMLETAWRLEGVEGGRATMKGTPMMSIMPPIGDDPTAPKGEVESQEGAVTLVWSVEDGAIESRESMQRVKTRWSMAGMSLTQEQDVRMKVVRAE